LKFSWVHIFLGHPVNTKNPVSALRIETGDCYITEVPPIETICKKSPWNTINNILARVPSPPYIWTSVPHLIPLSARLFLKLNTFDATRRHFTLWRGCRGVRHGVIERYKMHFESVTGNVHLLRNWLRRRFVTGVWYLQSFILGQSALHN